MATLLSRSITCIGCNAKNPASAERCRICTAPLHFTGNEIAVEHNRDLYSHRVSHWKPERTNARWVMAALVVIAGAITFNYMQLGWGPKWAHRPMTLGSTERWATYKGFGDGIVVRLPGAPIERGTGDGEGVEAISVVDRTWKPVLDQTTTTPKQITAAKAGRTATVVAAVVPSVDGPPTIGLDERVSSMVQDATISGARTSIVKEPRFGVEGDLVANFSGYPEANRSGVVKARAYQVGETTLIIATFFERGVDNEMHNFVLSTVSIG